VDANGVQAIEVSDTNAAYMREMYNGMMDAGALTHEDDL